eukprot:gnl/TRDRNA2_/TRDRNA2_92794_c0_seq1.p1 gnl/TRDRNA2_/TRDRNA2_92794_c0~~gnl/TRDRNA2_/TRDRNA2_92794_c0_seq1.p1  ORF type:complete len:277 (-),score=48.34 gnl/TRDRNA2_/TRDRNA2_92794_c0_seq1:13-843(-)
MHSMRSLLPAVVLIHAAQALIQEEAVREFILMNGGMGSPDFEGNSSDLLPSFEGARDEASDELVADVARRLHVAIRSGNHALIAKFFKALRNSPQVMPRILSWPGEDGFTAVHWAAADGSVAGAAMLKLFLAFPGLDITSVTKQGQTPCHLACEAGSTMALELLLNASQPCRPGDPEAGGRSCAHLAAAGGYVDVLQKIWELGILGASSLDAQTKHRDTALSLAVAEMHVEAARWLSSQGADATVGPTAGGARGLALQKLAAYSEIVQLLAEYQHV